MLIHSKKIKMKIPQRENGRMKIAFVMHPWTGITEGGAIGIITSQIAKRLSEKNDVVIYGGRLSRKHKLPQGDGIQYHELPIKLDKQFVRFLRFFDKTEIFHNPKRPFFVSRLYYLEYAIKAALQIKRERCDVIHIHSLSQFVPIIRSLNPNAAIVLHMHADWLTMVDHKLNERRLPQADLVISCSDYMTRKIKSEFPAYADKCKTLFNGVDVDAFSGERKNSLKQNSGAKKILFVGRISPEKGIHTLIDAYKKVAEKMPETELHLVGPVNPLPPQFIVSISDDEKVHGLQRFYNGNGYIEDLRKMIPKELKDKIIFHDAVSREKIAEYYLDADVLINPSFYETFGMSLVEAMSLKVPVIASRVGGMVEVVNDGENGILVEAGNAEELYDAITKLLTDRELNIEMGIKGRARAEELFSWNTITDSLFAEYKNLIHS
jgi:glycosyltransferase involved in cell wall biosynthesis